MDFMAFICDYALIDPITLCYKVDHVASGVAFATYKDVDADCFSICVFPVDTVIPDPMATAIADAVRNYLFDE